MFLTLSGKSAAPEVCCQRKENNALRVYANEHRKRGTFNDVTINVGEKNIPANRMVLSCYSKFFEELFKSELKDNSYQGVESKHIDSSTMELIIEYIYTGMIQINTENVCSLTQAAYFLQMNDLKLFCLEYLETALSAKASITILRLAEGHRYEGLIVKSSKFIAENFDEVIRADDFKNLPLAQMRECLSKQDKDEVGETTMYNAVILWVNHDVEDRRKDFPDLFLKVNLLLLPLEFLEDIVSNEPLVRGHLPSLKRLHDAVVQLEKQIRNRDCRSCVVSLGGHKTQTKVFEIFNLKNDKRKKYPSIPVGQSSLCVAVLEGYVYCIGGQTIPLKNEASSNLVYRMSLINDVKKWEKVASMNKKRYVMGAAVLNDALFVVGGTDEIGSKLSSGEFFTASSNRWKNIASMNTPRSGSALVSCKGHLYSIGGFGNGKHLNSAERFDPHTKEWSSVASMHASRRWLVAVVLNDFIYAIGGQPAKENETILSSVEVYDVTNNSWRNVGSLRTGRAACSACVLQGRIYVNGGLDRNGIAVNTIECYNASFDQWTEVGETEEDLWHHATIAV